MITKTNLIRGLIALVLLVAVTVTSLALAADSNDQLPEVEAAAPQTEALIERVSVESRLDYQYALKNSNGLALESEAAVQTEIPAASVEQIPAESKLDYWYARQNSNGALTP